MKRKPVEPFDYVDAMPINGYLTHAVRFQPEHFHRTAPYIVVTYMRALCGVGRGGMRVRLDQEGAIQPFKGVDGCTTCHVRVNKLRQAAE
jgi:hypothetical protein